MPNLGRFASADTIVPDPTNPQQFNRFAYVLNNPIRLIDPSGHCSEGTDYIDVDCWLAYNDFIEYLQSNNLLDAYLEKYGYTINDIKGWNKRRLESNKSYIHSLRNLPETMSSRSGSGMFESKICE